MTSKRATRAQAVAALAAHCPGATLLDESGPNDYAVQLEAPPGHHWDGHVHCHCCGSWYRNNDKGEYWAFVVEEIKNHLPAAVPCVDNDCEGIAQWGVCEYWEDEK